MKNQMEEKFKNAFEININESKLSKIMKNIYEQIEVQNKKIEDLEYRWIRTKREDKENISQHQRQFKNQITKQTLIYEGIENKLNKQIMPEIEKLNKNLLIHEQEDQQKYEILDTSIKNQCEGIQNLFQNSKSNHQQEQLKLMHKIHSLSSSIEYIQETIEKQKLAIFEGSQKIQSIRDELHFFKSNYSENKTQKQKIKNVQKDVDEQKDNMIRQINKIKTIEYASISKKVDSLEQKIEEVNSKPLNITAYPRSSQPVLTIPFKRQAHVLSKTCNFGDICYDVSEENSLDDQPIAKQLCHTASIQNIVVQTKPLYIHSPSDSLHENVLNKFEEKFNLKVNAFEKQFEIIKFKIDAISQKSDMVFKKVSKFREIETNLKSKFEALEKSKIQNHTIEEISNNFKKITKILENEEDRYLTNDKHQIFEKEIQKNIEELNKLVFIKANKDETKEAFAFFEKKMKEIVLVMSGQFQKEKEGALNKIVNMKCLTCDKEAQNEGQQENKKNENLRKTLKTCESVRDRSQKLRKNLRCVYKNIKTEHQ